MKKGATWAPFFEVIYFFFGAALGAAFLAGAFATSAFLAAGFAAVFFAEGLAAGAGATEGRDANVSNANRGVLVAAIETMSRRRTKFASHPPNTRSLRSHIGIANPW